MQVIGRAKTARSQISADAPTPRRSLSVLIVDDHPIIATACRALFARNDDVTIIEASDAESGESAFAAVKPDVCVLDVNLPGVSGFELARRILVRSPLQRVIMFSVKDDPIFAKRAIETGAMGYVSKSCDPADLACAIREVAAGRVFLPTSLARRIAFGEPQDRKVKLTMREIEILRLLASGSRLAEIASSIKVSYKGVVKACSIIRRKLGLRTSAEMVRFAIEEELG